jgi:hypothetical protein
MKTLVTLKMSKSCPQNMYPTVSTGYSGCVYWLLRGSGCENEFPK